MKKVMGNDKLSKFDKRFGPDFPSDKDIPAVLILKRKAIRVYPDNQKIALYYSQALDKYVSIPFGPGTASLGIHINESAPKPPKPSKEEEELEKRKAALKKARYSELSVMYGEYKKDADVKKLVGRIARNLSPQQRRRVKSKFERQAVDQAVKSGIKNADKPWAWKAGAQTARIADNLFSNFTRKDAPKSKPAPKPIPESFKNKLSALREERELDEGVGIAAKLGWEALKAGARRGARGGKAAYLRAKRSRLGRLAGKGAALAAGVGGALAGIAADTAGDEAKFTKAGEFGNIEPKVAGPGERESADAHKIRVWRAMNQPDPQAMRESNNNLDVIRHIVENDIKSYQLHFGDRSVPLNNSVAKKVLKIYESVNKTNKKKIEKMLNEDVTSFRKVINFAIRQ